MTEPVDDIAERIRTLNLPPDERKNFLRALVAKTWPPLPSYSTLKTPKIQEVETATVGTGVVLTFRENGIQKAVVVKAGTHYANSRYAADPAIPTYMILGGFANLTETPGSAALPADPHKAEQPRAAAVREMEEEMIDDKGAHILNIAPERLKPMDTQTLTLPWGERRVVIGFTAELTPQEVAAVKAHVSRLETDADYRHAVRAHTINEETGKPEICTISILPLKELAEGKHTLLHPAQRSLFSYISNHLDAAKSR